MIPVIAVSCRRLQHGSDSEFLAQGALSNYLTALASVGAATILIPSQALECVSIALSRADALMLVGGEDIAAFAKKSSGVRKNVDCDRDEVEFALVRAALRERLPVLGICRGLQVLNVALGGTVRPVEEIALNPIRHVADWRSGERYVHKVALSEGSLLASLCGGSGLLHVNGAHAFCVDRIGQGLRVGGIAPDGVVEALESAGDKDCIGVQWHPEKLAADGDDRARRLFEWLVERAVVYRGGRS